VKSGLNISFFGSSPVSDYRNDEAMYRGVIRALQECGHRADQLEKVLLGISREGAE
jgi:hypothetical protein